MFSWSASDMFEAMSRTESCLTSVELRLTMSFLGRPSVCNPHRNSPRPISIACIHFPHVDCLGPLGSGAEEGDWNDIPTLARRDGLHTPPSRFRWFVLDLLRCLGATLHD